MKDRPYRAPPDLRTAPPLGVLATIDAKLETEIRADQNQVATLRRQLADVEAHLAALEAVRAARRQGCDDVTELRRFTIGRRA